MEALRRLRSRSVALPVANIDTDQIIPARFLTTTSKHGLGRHAFHDWRYRADGSPDPTFPLNRPEARDAAILLAGPNFGCGSSREHAPWALLDAGIRAVLSTQIADIFRNNALKNGLLALTIAPQAHAELLAAAGEWLCIDVERQCIERAGGAAIEFVLDPFVRHCLLEGVDELGYLLERLPRIEAYEERRPWPN